MFHNRCSVLWLCSWFYIALNLELSASATSIFIANGTSSTNGTAAFTITPSATATVVPLVFTFTTTVSTTGFDTIDLPDGSIRHHVTLSGPTTYIVTYSVPSDLYTGVIDVAGPDIYTDTEVLDEGTVTIEVPVGGSRTPVTLVGPTTYIATLTAADGNIPDDLPVSEDPSDPRCHQTATMEPSKEFITYAQRFTVLTDHETLITALPAPSTYSAFLSDWTYVGPTTVSTTWVRDLFDVNGRFGLGNPIAPEPYAPCGGACGICQLYFPTVYVYYWAVESPNTACLDTAYTTATLENITSSANAPQPRGLSKITDTVSTLVNSEGFTFTSPSVYIAYPTILAQDNCGTLGSVHTSITLGYPPEEISTVVWSENYSQYYRFNFSDAHCLPTSLQDSAISIIGQTGYNPILAPLPNLTLLDPAWNADCVAALFQANDPPHAITPAANLSPWSTTVDPIPLSTPASPSSGLPTIPKQTDPPASPTASYVQTSNDPGALPQETNSPSPSSRPSSAPEDPPEPSIKPVTAPAGSDDPHSVVRASDKTAPSPQSATNSQDLYGQPDGLQPSVELSNIAGSATVESPVFSIGGLTVNVNSASSLIIGSHTLVAGGPAITISNEPISLAASASYLAVGSYTQALDAALAVLTFGDQTYTINPASVFTIGTQTLAPGGIITVSGTPISLALSGSYIVEGSSTIAFSPETTVSPSKGPEVLTFKNRPYTENSASAFVIGTQTLVPGGVITISGTPISLALSGSYVVEGSSTMTVFPIPASSLPPGGPEILTFAGQPYTVNSASDYIINGQTLVPGAAITVSGTPISLAAQGTEVVIGTSTEGLGGLIMSGFGDPPGSSVTVSPFQGAAVKSRISGGWALGVMGGIVMGGLAMAW